MFLGECEFLPRGSFVEFHTAEKVRFVINFLLKIDMLYYLLVQLFVKIVFL